MIDYLGDFKRCDAYSMTQRLEVDRDVDALLKTIADEGAVVGAGRRDMRVRSAYTPNSEPMIWATVFVVLALKNALPSNVRVPREFTVGAGVTASAAGGTPLPHCVRSILFGTQSGPASREQIKNKRERTHAKNADNSTDPT